MSEKEIEESTVRSIVTFVAIVAGTISCGFSFVAEEKKATAAESSSAAPSPKPGEKSEETVPREFWGFADVSEFPGVIDDPDGYVDLRKEKRADAPVITSKSRRGVSV
jgi:hypothetical protein